MFRRMVVGFMRGKVITEVPLDPEKQYIFGAHPHGINTWNHFLTVRVVDSATDSAPPGAASSSPPQPLTHTHTYTCMYVRTHMQ